MVHFLNKPSESKKGSNQKALVHETYGLFNLYEVYSIEIFMQRGFIIWFIRIFGKSLSNNECAR